MIKIRSRCAFKMLFEHPNNLTQDSKGLFRNREGAEEGALVAFADWDAVGAD